MRWRRGSSPREVNPPRCLVPLTEPMAALDRTDLMGLVTSRRPTLCHGIRWPTAQGYVSPFAVCGVRTCGRARPLLKGSRVFAQVSLELSQRDRAPPLTCRERFPHGMHRSKRYSSSSAQKHGAPGIGCIFQGNSPLPFPIARPSPGSAAKSALIEISIGPSRPVNGRFPSQGFDRFLCRSRFLCRDKSPRRPSLA